MNKSQSLPLIMLLLLIASCSRGVDQQSSENVQSLTLSETEESFPLRDDLRLMGSVQDILPVSSNELVVMDNSPGISLFRDHEMVNTIGSEGKGPCEYTGIKTNMDMNGDSLFILNQSLNKIITYNIRSGECLGETSHPILINMDYLKRVDGFFYTARTVNNAFGTPDSTKLLFKVFDNGKSEKLSLEYGEIEALDTPLFIPVFGLNFVQSGDSLYSYFPMTDIITVMDIENEQFDRFPLQIDIGRKELEEAGENLNRIREVLRDGMERVWFFTATENWLAVGSGKQNNPNDEAIQWLQFYSSEGAFINELVMDELPAANWGNRLIFLREATDPSSQYAYELVYRDVIAE